MEEQQNNNFTTILNAWSVNGDINDANKLKSMVYYHLKGIVKKQIADKASTDDSLAIAEQLLNTTSFLHEVLIQLIPPQSIMNNREEYYLSLALFVRWMLLDELKAKQAKKRSYEKESITQLLNLDDSSDPYFHFDDAFLQLKKLAPRSYNIALLHYYLGFKVTEMTDIVSLKSAMIYNELATAKAYIRSQYSHQ